MHGEENQQIATLQVIDRYNVNTIILDIREIALIYYY